MCKKRVSILTTEDSAPLRSRAIRRLVFLKSMFDVDNLSYILTTAVLVFMAGPR